MIALIDAGKGRHGFWRVVQNALLDGIPDIQLVHPHEFLGRFDEFSAMVHMEFRPGGSAPCIEACRRAGKPHYWVENSYLKGEINTDQTVNESSWVRISRGNRPKFRKYGPQRWEKHFYDIEIKPWNDDIDLIVFCVAADDWKRFMPECERWEREQYDFAMHSRIKIIKRPRIPLPKEHLHEIFDNNKCALITHASVVAVDAICQGVPVIVSPESICYEFSRANYLNLWKEDRQLFFNLIANSQFMISEIRSGEAWSILKTA